MEKRILLPLFFFFGCIVFAQNGNEFIETTVTGILPDNDYTIEQVANDSVIFQNDLTLKDYEINSAYWIKSEITNTSDRYREYYLGAFPFLDNAYYYYDQKQDKWIILKGGLASKEAEAKGKRGAVKMGFYPNQTTDLYIKTNLEKFSGQSYHTTANLNAVNAEDFDRQAQQTCMYWLITAVVIVMFFVFNGYVYLMFRDRTYLYYLATLVSGLLYVTSLSGLFHRFLPFRIFQAKICNEDNLVCYFDFDLFVTNISIALVIGYFIAFAQEFLRTSTILPKWNKFLKYTKYVFVSYMFVSSVITYSGLAYLKSYGFALIENIVIAFIICFIIASGIIAYRKKFKPAKYFLAANTVQLVMMVILAVYLMINKNYGTDISFLPHAALLVQALTFAVSLVARVNLLKDELQTKQEESIRLQHHNELMELEKQKLQEETDFKNRQLATTTMHLYNKNEILSELHTHIKKISKSQAPDEVITQIKSTINNNMYIDADWKKFKLHFEQVHPAFFKELVENHPDLTAYEVRLCAYLHLQLSTKEIATLLNIESPSVRKAKMRLKKKMNTDWV